MAEKEKKGSAKGAYLPRTEAMRVFQALNKLHGEGSIAVASQGRRFRLDRFSTGSLALDFALGGGIAAERTTKLVGQESSGKTTLALRIAADAQRRCANCLRYVTDIAVQEDVNADTGEVTVRTEARCDCFAAGLFKPVPAAGEKEDDFAARVAGYEANSYDECRVVYVDAENALDLPWAQTVGVDLRRFVHVKPQSAQQAVDLYEDLLCSGMADLLILDSIAALAPIEEIEAKAEDQQQGLAARIWNKWVRIANSGSIGVDLGGGRSRAPTQVWINQLRQKIGVMFGDGLVEPGGMGQKFAASAKVKLWQAKWEKRKLLDSLPKDEQIDIGEHVDICWIIEKNKNGPAKGEGRFTQYVSGARAGQIDEWGFVAHLAERYGILRSNEKKTAWFLGNEEFKRKAEAHARMQQPHVMQALRGKLLGLMNEERDK